MNSKMLSQGWSFDMLQYWGH